MLTSSFFKTFLPLLVPAVADEAPNKLSNKKRCFSEPVASKNNAPIKRVRKLCDEPNCDKCARGKTSKCVNHGGGKRCSEPACKAGARDKTGKCIGHGGGKRCSELTCKAGAHGKTDKCVSHGGGKRCSEPTCKAGAEGKTDKCVSHGGGKRCSEPKCKAGAEGNTDQCIGHGGGKRCSEPNCDKSAQDSKTSKCAGHGGGNRCVSCVIFGVPKKGAKCSMCDPASKTATKLLSKERVILELLVSSFPGYEIIYNTSVGTECGRYRPDVRIDAHTHFVIVEIDEHMHDGYDKDCEKIRQENITQALGLPCIFIRYNPDAHHDPLTKKSIYVSSAKRQQVLVERVAYHLATRPVWLVDKTHDTEFLFYNEDQKFISKKRKHE